MTMSENELFLESFRGKVLTDDLYNQLIETFYVD